MVDPTIHKDDGVVVGDVVGDVGGIMTILGSPKWRNETGAPLEV
jgi:hypothetical protein